MYILIVRDDSLIKFIREVIKSGHTFKKGRTSKW
jgi:hypothetical protein